MPLTNLVKHRGVESLGRLGIIAPFKRLAPKRSLVLVKPHGV